jgi:prephenate dehydratase
MGDSTKQRVAFQGERGAFSEEAAVKLLGSQIELVPRATFDAMFRAIDEGRCRSHPGACGKQPGGFGLRMLRPAAQSQLKINAEVISPISTTHRAAGAAIEQVRSVQSHPVRRLLSARDFSSSIPRSSASLPKTQAAARAK